MKQFLYLDTDIVKSIIAQSEQGLIESLSNEKSTGKTDSDNLKGAADVGLEFGGSIIRLLRAEADLKGSIEFEAGSSSTSTSHEIIKKTIHDAAFDIAYSYISPTKIANGDQSADDTGNCTGNYIEMTRIFDFIDFDYFEGLFRKDGIIDFIKKNTAEQMEAYTEKRNEKYCGELSSEAEIYKTIAVNNKEYDDIATVIKALRTLIPYNRMLISNDGYLIPLDTKYFRVDPVDLGFKYGGEITCVGMITNIIGEDANPNDDKNVFATLQFTANEVLRNILPTNENNLCVIHPIAIYYEANI
ncbi:MAG: hypothetical protein LIO87_06010 [Eubacterium sp.]|nr:hypothetical protein [Eubacterium sp.]